MSISHKGGISFGLVFIPVKLYTATQDNDIRFNQLHLGDNARIRYKKVCSHCGKEVSTKEIIKGFEYADDKFVVVTDDDFENIKTEQDKTIKILHFANLNQISPIYYDKTYHAIPEAGGEKAFELLRVSMMEEQKIAICQTVMGTKETLLAIIPREDGILIEKMFYQDEIKDLPTYPKTDINEAELKMAKLLIESMDSQFDASQYKDEYQIRLKELIEQKIEGKEIVAAASAPKNNIINLMDALKASVEQRKPIEKKPRPRRKPKGA